MAFSIKNIFHKGGGAESHAGAAPDGGGFFGGNGAAVANGPFAAAFSSGGEAPQSHGQVPANNQGQPQPPGFGGTLFKTVGSDNLDGAPVSPTGGSPFAPYASPERTTLTAGDFLPHLPADVSRANGVMPDQPVAISPQALEAAISSGQLAVPLFEIYHVCPALFRVPVSPHDTRLVPLPKSKLPGMIASHTSALKPPSGPANMQASPFGAAASGQPPANPFAPALPELPPHSGPMGGAGTRPAGTLPPRRPPGTAPAIPTQADFIGQNSLSLPNQNPGAPEGMPMSRSLLQPIPGGEPPPSFQPSQLPGGNGSPFGTMPQQPPGGNGSPFGTMPQQPPGGNGSPFGTMPQQPSGENDSPFAAMPPQMQPQQAPPLQPAPGATSLLFGIGKPPSDPELQSPAPGAAPLGPQPGSPFGSMPGASPFGEAPGAGSPFQAGYPGMSPAASPFSAEPTGGGSPYQDRQADESMGSPFQSATPGGRGSPFQSALPTDSGSPFHPPTIAAPTPLVQPLPFSPFGSLPAGDQSSPFAAQMPGQPDQQPGASPFASMPPVASFEVPPRQVTPEPPKLGNLPFSAQTSRPMISGQPGANPNPNSYGAPPGSPPPGPKASDEMMEVSLAAVLKGQTAQDLGFDPNFIPGWITTKLPAADVREQLGSGQVALALGAIIDGTDHSFRSVISHGRRDFTVRVMASEVFQTMAPASSTPSLTPASPAQAAPPSSAPPQQAFQPPQQAFQPSQQAFLSSPQACEPPPMPMFSAATPPAAESSFASPNFESPQPPPMPAFPFAASNAAPEPPKPFDPFAAAAGEWGGKAGSPLFAPAPEIHKPEGLSSEQLFAEKPALPPTPPQSGGPMFASAPERTPAPVSFFADPAPAKPASPPLRDEIRTPSGPLARAVDSFFEPAPEPAYAPAPQRAPAAAPAAVFAPAPAPAPQRPAPAPAAAGIMPGLSLSAAGDNDQLMLRALLGVSEKLSGDAIVDHTSRLPGVAACAWIKNGKIIAHGDGSKPAQDFRQQASDIATSMRTLARLTGLEAETLSIAVGDRMLTFCLQRDQSLGVLHTSMEPPSGLREKITLLSRELAQMSGD